jgi:hypothetical protein
VSVLDKRRAGIVRWVRLRSVNPNPAGIIIKTPYRPGSARPGISPRSLSIARSVTSAQDLTPL